MSSHFRPVAPEHASRLINHGPTVLVTSAHAGRRNIMAAAWSMPVEFTPPRVAVVIDKRTFTRELVAASGAFALCLPGPALADLSFAVGSESGREVDKFARHGIVATSGPVLGMPVLEAGCAAWLECRLIPETHTEEAYDTCFAEVVARGRGRIAVRASMRRPAPWAGSPAMLAPMASSPTHCANCVRSVQTVATKSDYEPHCARRPWALRSSAPRRRITTCPGPPLRRRSWCLQRRPPAPRLRGRCHPTGAISGTAA